MTTHLQHQLVVLTPEQLRALVSDAIAGALARVGANETGTLTLRDCGVPIRTLRKAIKDGELPAALVGREYRVRPEDLQTWLDSRAVTPRPQVKRDWNAATALDALGAA